MKDTPVHSRTQLFSCFKAALAGSSNAASTLIWALTTPVIIDQIRYTVRQTNAAGTITNSVDGTVTFAAASNVINDLAPAFPDSPAGWSAFTPLNNQFPFPREVSALDLTGRELILLANNYFIGCEAYGQFTAGETLTFYLALTWRPANTDRTFF